MPAPTSMYALVLLAMTAIGNFENHGDVGKVDRPGSAAYDDVSNQYRVTGSGANVWGREDAFHFLYRATTGDVTVTADVRFEGVGKDAHRKACVMVRQGLAADDPYVGVAVHGDGLVSLQYRPAKGGVTEEVKAATRAPADAPARVRLRREGDVFTMLLAADGKTFAPAGSATVNLKGAAYAGLAVCSHDATVSETAVFSNVAVEVRHHDD